MTVVQVTGLTSARMLTIEAASVVSGAISGDDLILTKHDGSTVNAGNVRGPQGIPGTTSGTAGGDLAGTYPNPTVKALAITDAKVAAANKDGVAATASMRTLGTGAQQAMAGNDSRINDTGWTNFTLTGTNAGNIAWRIHHGVMYIALNGVGFATPIAIAGPRLTVVTAANGIASANRPNVALYTPVFGGNAVGFVNTALDGSLTINASTAALSSAAGIFSYPIT